MPKLKHVVFALINLSMDPTVKICILPRAPIVFPLGEMRLHTMQQRQVDLDLQFVKAGVNNHGRGNCRVTWLWIFQFIYVDEDLEY